MTEVVFPYKEWPSFMLGSRPIPEQITCVICATQNKILLYKKILLAKSSPDKNYPTTSTRTMEEKKDKKTTLLYICWVVS